MPQINYNFQFHAICQIVGVTAVIFKLNINLFLFFIIKKNRKLCHTCPMAEGNIGILIYYYIIGIWMAYSAPNMHTDIQLYGWHI